MDAESSSRSKIIEIKVSPAVIAAHEAGHAVAAIVFGATFAGIKITPDGGVVARVVEVHGLSEVGKVRTFLAGSAGERAAFGSDDRRLSFMDQALLTSAIEDFSLLACADQRADEVIAKYKAAHKAISKLIAGENKSGVTDLIPPAVVIEIAEQHGAQRGAEEPGPPAETAAQIEHS